MTSQISFGIKEVGLGVREDKGDEAVCVTCLPVDPLWIAVGVFEFSCLADVRREDVDSVRRHILWCCHQWEKEKKLPTMLVSLNVPGRYCRLNWRKSGFPAVMFCPFERRCNSEMSLGEGVDEWFFSITLHFLPHWTQYLWLIEFLPHCNMVTNSIVWCCTDSCSSCPFYLVGSKNLLWLIELYSHIWWRDPLWKKRIGCEAELIWVGDGRLPATSKVSLLIRGVRFAAKANNEGSFAASAVPQRFSFGFCDTRSAAPVSSPLGPLSGWARIFFFFQLT